jgi:hypothetical protein
VGENHEKGPVYTNCETALMLSCFIMRRDWCIVGLLIFFISTGLVIDLRWVLNHDHLPRIASTDWLGAMYRSYSVADRGYYDRVGMFELALEVINVTVTQVLNLALLAAIFRRSPWRYPLQLAVGSYVAYSVMLDYWVAAAWGYPNMPHKTPYAFLLFYGASMPWLLAHLYIAWDAARAVNTRFRAA